MNRILRASTLVTVLALFATTGRSQHALLTDHDWGERPVRPDTTLLDGGNSLIMKRNSIGQFVDDGEMVSYYEVFHLQRYLHNAAAVDGSKTITLGTGHISDLIRIRARSTAPDGRVNVLPPSAFLKQSDDSGENGLYFAFEGLEPGSIIEYEMLSRQRPEMRGTVERLQFGAPVLEQSFEMLVPNIWHYVFKGYNGVPAVEADSSLEGIIRHHLVMRDVPALEEESQSNVGNYRMYMVHKLDAIPSRNVRDISSYTNATRNYHKALYPELGPKTKKELATRLKKMNLGYARDEEDRIRTMDLYIRNNFRLVDMNSAELADIDAILRTGNSSEFGLQRLYCVLFREAGIEHHVVVTTDATETPFDPDNEAFNFLRTVCFYFPKPDKYLDPSDLSLGLGYLSPEFMGTHGLYIRSREVGGVATGIGVVKPIPSLPAEATRHDIALTMRLSDDCSEANIELENGLTGYYARNIQNFYSYMNESQRNELLQNMLGHFTEGSSEQSIDVEFGEAQWFGVKPFTMKAKVTQNKFTSQAGDEVLVRVGELIGPQMEMYVDKERKLPLDSGFNRYYDRRITVEIPEGWDCNDLSPMEIQKTLEVDGKVQAEFRSTATMKDGQIVVDALEYYHEYHIPVEHYEAYRAVINAAADFNKRSLVFSRKP